MNTIKERRSAIIGAVFLMGLSAIGPGFLTQTTTFTDQLGSSFAFVILISIILDLGAQLNIWRIITVSNMRGQDIANKVIPGLGYFVSFLVVIGGLAFNIGNVAGAGLGINVFTGVSVEVGAMISAAIAIGIFMFKEAGRIMDKFVQYAGILMIFLTLYVVFKSSPPVGEAAYRSFIPESFDSGTILAIVTLVGGTVGGYITFAGAHRLLDAGVHGKEALSDVSKSSLMGIGVTAIMRVILFLAVLGVISQGYKLAAGNPVASVFEHAAGKTGHLIFGVIMWAAAVTSVIGAAYTSVTFLRIFSPKVAQHQNRFIIAFIFISTVVFVSVGRPVEILILVGALNGLILPLTLGPILIAAYKKEVVGDYKHPMWQTIFGAIVVAIMTALSIQTLYKYFIG
ncbi:divalent metal cation transporter [Ignatzschineria sp. RMDPL8A]|uniref:NRAMP family divalent metal transporter n=1 Tax=Ignatzschineria sp. RMDPL8A TaxID=2999236 RepID=UPI002446787A|nr:divalent metal cation transporter [Ignatzschineria sp. RMDPL8A]MDG9730102.1 divalent metal cation transporter [Ignatzschineria sp. RMDPL8A]